MCTHGGRCRHIRAGVPDTDRRRLFGRVVVRHGAMDDVVLTPKDWQDRRSKAHEQGRHVRPQIDCRRCWDMGAFSEPVPPEDQRVDPVPRHDGRHGPTCLACYPV